MKLAFSLKMKLNGVEEQKTDEMAFKLAAIRPYGHPLVNGIVFDYS